MITLLWHRTTFWMYKLYSNILTIFQGDVEGMNTLLRLAIFMIFMYIMPPFFDSSLVINILGGICILFILFVFESYDSDATEKERYLDRILFWIIIVIWSLIGFTVSNFYEKDDYAGVAEVRKIDVNDEIYDSTEDEME